MLNGEINEFVSKSQNFYYSDFVYDESGSKFTLGYYGRKCQNDLTREVERTPLGVHNILNLTMAFAVAKMLCIEDKYLLEGVKYSIDRYAFQKVEKTG